MINRHFQEDRRRRSMQLAPRLKKQRIPRETCHRDWVQVDFDGRMKEFRNAWNGKSF
jgi:hypothetical protein